MFRGGLSEACEIKPVLFPFRYKFAGGNKNFIQEKREKILYRFIIFKNGIILITVLLRIISLVLEKLNNANVVILRLE